MPQRSQSRRLPWGGAALVDPQRRRACGISGRCDPRVRACIIAGISSPFWITPTLGARAAASGPRVGNREWAMSWHPRRGFTTSPRPGVYFEKGGQPADAVKLWDRRTSHLGGDRRSDARRVDRLPPAAGSSCRSSADEARPGVVLPRASDAGAMVQNEPMAATRLPWRLQIHCPEVVFGRHGTAGHRQHRHRYFQRRPTSRCAEHRPRVRSG